MVVSPQNERGGAMLDSRELRRSGSLWLVALAVASITTTASGGPPDEAKELEALLNEQTELATKTRMNHDYVPGMVTVLQGDELEGLGVRNVWEALSLVPG